MHNRAYKAVCNQQKLLHILDRYDEFMAWSKQVESECQNRGHYTLSLANSWIRLFAEELSVEEAAERLCAQRKAARKSPNSWIRESANESAKHWSISGGIAPPKELLKASSKGRRAE